jgi:hypothetical protein
VPDSLGKGMQAIVRLAPVPPSTNRSLPEIKVPLTNWRLRRGCPPVCPSRQW